MQAPIPAGESHVRYQLSAIGYRAIAHSRQQIAGSRQPIADSRSPTPDSWPPQAPRSPPMVHCASARPALAATPAAAALLLLAALPIAGHAQMPKPGLPLAPDRYATFTTSKGTWISLDVSPDGQTIVFDLLGDLYTLPITGGTATRFTSGMSHDMQPRWSPDGKRIAFVSDRSGDDNVWIMSADRKDTLQLTKGVDNDYISPEWTPDGNYIVVAKGKPFSNNKLWLYNVHGGHGLPLAGATPTTQRQMGPAFGPDGRYIWYAARQGSWQYNAVMPQFQLVVYDRETGTRTTMSSRYGSGVPSRALTRREVAHLRLPSRRRDRAPDPGARERGREVARLPDPAGRPGVGRQHGRAAGLLLHPGFEGGGDLLRRRDLAGAAGRGRGGDH